MTRFKDPSSSPIPDSVVGQPSIDITGAVISDDDDGDWKVFNANIARLCPNEDPTDVIMKVKIENDNFMEGSAPFSSRLTATNTDL